MYMPMYYFTLRAIIKFWDPTYCDDNTEVVGIGCEFATTLKFSYRKILFSSPFILSTKLKTKPWSTGF